MKTDKRVIDYLTANMKKWNRNAYFSIETIVNNLIRANTARTVTNAAIDKMMGLSDG